MKMDENERKSMKTDKNVSKRREGENVNLKIKKKRKKKKKKKCMNK